MKEERGEGWKEKGGRSGSGPEERVSGDSDAHRAARSFPIFPIFPFHFPSASGHFSRAEEPELELHPHHSRKRKETAVASGVMAEYEDLKELARKATEGADPAHDFQHVLRVAGNATTLCAAEGAEAEVVVPAALLHELFNLPKNHPDSARSGEICAERALAALVSLGWGAERAERVAYCIRVHGFSRGILPETSEARVLQDADRLDAIGAIGIARCFATGGSMGAAFYHPADPFAAHRELDDKRFSVDHFYRKLLRIEGTLHTATARRLAGERTRFMEAFLAQLGSEI